MVTVGAPVAKDPHDRTAKLASYQFYVLKKKNRQHENLQKCTIAIHLIAISPTRRCFPFLFMFSFSFPAILPLHVFFFANVASFEKPAAPERIRHTPLVAAKHNRQNRTENPLEMGAWGEEGATTRRLRTCPARPIRAHTCPGITRRLYGWLWAQAARKV